ncbi:unnamed protein product [Amoebophrya sp. A25]|nr:unnamed protein product [Amoebophrya sp. A25]|eukprot:GSA25T00005482001.1
MSSSAQHQTMSLQTIDPKRDYGIEWHQQQQQQQQMTPRDIMRTSDVEGATPKLKFYQTAATRTPWDPSEVQPERREFVNKRPIGSSLHCRDIERAQPKRDYMWRRFQEENAPLNPLQPNYQFPSNGVQPAYEEPKYIESSKPRETELEAEVLNKQFGIRAKQNREEALRQLPQDLLSLPYSTPHYYRKVHRPITETSSGPGFQEVADINDRHYVGGSSKTPRAAQNNGGDPIRNPLTPRYLMSGRHPDAGAPAPTVGGANYRSPTVDQYTRGGLQLEYASTTKQMGDQDLNDPLNPVTHCNLNIGNLPNGCSYSCSARRERDESRTSTFTPRRESKNMVQEATQRRADQAQAQRKEARPTLLRTLDDYRDDRVGNNVGASHSIADSGSMSCGHETHTISAGAQLQLNRFASPDSKTNKWNVNVKHQNYASSQASTTSGSSGRNAAVEHPSRRGSATTARSGGPPVGVGIGDSPSAKARNITTSDTSANLGYQGSAALDNCGGSYNASIIVGGPPQSGTFSEYQAEEAWRQNKSCRVSDYERLHDVAPRGSFDGSHILGRAEYERERTNDGARQEHALVENKNSTSTTPRNTSTTRGSLSARGPPSKDLDQRTRDRQNRQWHDEIVQDWTTGRDSKTSSKQSSSVSPRRSARVRALEPQTNANDFVPTLTVNNDTGASDIISANIARDPRAQPAPKREKYQSRVSEETGGDVFEHCFPSRPEDRAALAQELKPKELRAPFFGYQREDPSKVSLRSNLRSVNTATDLIEQDADTLEKYVEMNSRTHTILGGRKVFDDLYGGARLTGVMGVKMAGGSVQLHDEPAQAAGGHRSSPSQGTNHNTTSTPRGSNYTTKGAATGGNTSARMRHLLAGGNLQHQEREQNFHARVQDHDQQHQPPTPKMRVKHEIGPIRMNSPRKLFYERKDYKHNCNAPTDLSLQSRDIVGASPRVPKNAQVAEFRTRQHIHDVSDINMRKTPRGDVELEPLAGIATIPDAPSDMPTIFGGGRLSKERAREMAIHRR